MDQPSYISPMTWNIYRVLSVASAVASGFHGYKRHQNGNHPVAWALGWFLLGGLFPVITPTIAIAEGYAKALPAGEA